MESILIPLPQDVPVQVNPLVVPPDELVYFLERR
jgi:hypothetical protein